MAEPLYPYFEVPAEIAEDADETTEIVSPLRSLAFDYAAGQIPISMSGRPAEVVDHEAYKQWVIKCILTERYEYPAYGPDFGTELHAIMRAGYPSDVTESEIQRTITEALRVDPRTVTVDNFSFEWNGDAVKLYFEVESVYGRDSFGFTLQGVR